MHIEQLECHFSEHSINASYSFVLKYLIYLLVFRESGREGERKRNTDWLPFTGTPNWGQNPQPRHVPRLGFEQ